MDYKVIFSIEVQAEMQQSFDWYEEKQIGLGERFLNIIEISVSVISKFPEIFAVRTKTFREYVVPKFPSVIVYEIIPDKNLIYILHIFNTYLSPNKN